MKRILSLGLILLFLVGCQTSTANIGDTLTVGLECNYAPFNWLQNEESDTSVYVESAGAYCDGYDVVMASAIADELGRELIVEQVAWEGLIPALQSNSIDAIIAGMSYTPDRAEEVLFTDPYYMSEYVMIVSSDSEYVSATSLTDFSGADIVGQLNTNYDIIIDQIEGVNHLTPLGTYPLIVHALLTDVADGAPAEKPTALAIIEANPELAIVEFESGQGFEQTKEVTTEVSVAVRLEDTELADQINDVLNNISQDTREQWMNQAIENQGE